MVLWPIYFVVLLVILKLAAYRPTSFPAMEYSEVLDFDNYLQNISQTFKSIYVAPNFAAEER